MAVGFTRRASAATNTSTTTHAFTPDTTTHAFTPTPPPTPRPPPGKWNKTQCSMGQTGGADVREHVAVVFKGTQTGSYEGGLKYCQDCIVRCYLQQKHNVLVCHLIQIMALVGILVKSKK
eukprot:TRINITY_DN596_c0_g1_i1.p4 TRINITY_DN596_c0_g1~~TRINITY_DN596_c0_g1_i1.p4  ORF type:complete len:120 (-),score=20.17 TRINITY_DN596_c0_g1_i1:507-866(-)